MVDLKEALRNKVDQSSPTSILFSVLVIGILSGTGGTVAAGNLLGIVGAVPEEQFKETVEELNTTLRRLNQTITDQQHLLANTRCEVRMLRESGDWRDCWAPGS
jgi:hypothetical protein